ncbi:uncharacterized protein LOC121708937 [Alosa sapidissima]|uniref:uncharacterized protein LOC121708937 n=1 Tax=Alosa sapidissima TaxID=34773 RepID=UPI001C095F4B|nr:uncharacterized protein LOC121708937 [Alosa sapidissima]
MNIDPGSAADVLSRPRDAEVVCAFQEDCVLPCRFLQGGMVIHWYKQQIPVHSYYYHKDQLRLQNKHFSGRTHLFNAHIANGNASLMLRRVKVQDQGRYKCFTSTRKDSQETFVNLRVKALISLVRMEMTNESVSCQSQHIYPAPEVWWSTDPALPPHALVNSTRTTPDSRGLFTVESSVGIVGNVSDYTYFCSVVSADGAQVWTVSHRQQADIVDESGGSVLVPCVAPKDFTLQNFTLSWTFSPSSDPSVDPSALLTYDSRTRQTSMPSEGVELDQEQVLLGNGSLRLLSPESAENTGHYTCTFSALQTRHLVQTWVNITDRSADEDHRVCKRSWWGTAASICVFVVTMAAGVTRCFRMGGSPSGHANGGKLVKISMSQLDVPMLALPGTDATGSDGSALNDGGGLRLHAARADQHITQGHTDRGSGDFQRHPIPECGAAEIEPSGGDDPGEFLRGSDVTIPPEFGTDWPDPPVPGCDAGTPCAPGSESVGPGPGDSDPAVPQHTGGGESTPQVTGNDVTTLHTTGNDVLTPGMPGQVMVIHCEAERAPKDQTQRLSSANSDSYFLKLALFPSRKDIIPNILEGDDSVFIVPEQFQINGFR